MARSGHRRNSDAIVTGTFLGLCIATLSFGLNAFGGPSLFAGGLFPVGREAAHFAATGADDAHVFSELTVSSHRHDDVGADCVSSLCTATPDAPGTAATDQVAGDARWLGSLKHPAL